MPYEYGLLSPEKVELRYELGGIGSRALATAFDDLLVVLANAVILTIGSFVVERLVRTGVLLSSTLLGWLIGGFIFFAFCSWVGYYILFEILWNGQTLGKRLLGLRVIRFDGTPVSPGSIFARELLRVVDAFPLCFPTTYVIGGTVAFFNPYFQRIGDMVAGTLVIKERRTAVPEIESLGSTSLEVHPFESWILSAQAMSATDYRVVKDFLARQDQIDPAVRRALAERLLARLLPRLELARPPEDAAPEALLEAISRFYLRQRGALE